MEGALLTSSPSAVRFDEEADAVRFDMFADGRGGVRQARRKESTPARTVKNLLLYSGRPSMLLLLLAAKNSAFHQVTCADCRAPLAAAHRKKTPGAQADGRGSKNIISTYESITITASHHHRISISQWHRDSQQKTRKVRTRVDVSVVSSGRLNVPPHSF